MKDSLASRPQATDEVVPRPARLSSIDAFRGLVMLLLLAEVLHTCEVAAALPQSLLWGFTCLQQTHAEWVGAHLHDFIQPGFTFLVGVSIPFAIAHRQRGGTSSPRMLAGAAWRSALLVVLGIAMLSVHPRHLLWKFEDTLTEIGLGYLPVFALALWRPRLWGMVLALLLLGEWALFAAHPLPGPGFDYAAVGVGQDWLLQHGLSGWEAHWQKNANVAFAFDRWFLELLPGNEHYIAPKGLTTLNFIPMIATMILGLMAGRLLREPVDGSRRVRLLATGGAASLAVGLLLGASGLLPVVKSLWTPSWVLFSGGICLLVLAALHALVDLRGWHRAVWMLVVIGSNSLAAYLMHNLYRAFAWNSLRRLFGARIFEWAGAAYAPFLYGLAVMGLYWLVLWTMYRRRWYLKI